MLFDDHYIADDIYMHKHRAVRRNGSGLIGLSGAVGELMNGYVWAKHRSVRENVGGLAFSALCRSAVLALAALGSESCVFVCFTGNNTGKIDRNQAILSLNMRV